MCFGRKLAPTRKGHGACRVPGGLRALGTPGGIVEPASPTSLCKELLMSWAQVFRVFGAYEMNFEHS